MKSKRIPSTGTENVVFSTKRLLTLFLIAFSAINMVLILIVDNKPMLDAENYHTLAKKVQEMGEFYPHRDHLYGMYIRPSFYINTLATMYRIFGVRVTYGKVMNLLSSIGSYLFLLGITTWLFGKKKGYYVLLSVLYIGYVNISFMNLLLLTEPLFLFFLLGAFLAVLKMIQWRMGAVYAIIAGVSVSLAILTRPLAILASLCLLIALIVEKVKLRYIALFLVSSVLVIAMYGWNVRSRLGKFNAWGTTAGINLLMGNNPYANGKYNRQAVGYIRSLNVSGMDVFEKNEFYREKALGYIASHPIKCILLIPKKMVYLFLYDGQVIEQAFNKLNIVDHLSLRAIYTKLRKGFVSWAILANQMIYALLLFLVLYGIGSLIRSREYRILIYVLMLPISLIAMTLPAFGMGRFHYPIMVMSLPVAAYGLSRFRILCRYHPATQAVVGARDLNEGTTNPSPCIDII